MRKGFTLVELMIGVAIVGILASIAVPQLQAMQLKAKRSEAPANVNGISDAASAYYASYGEWLDGCSSNPGSPLNKQAKAWVPNQDACWTALAWTPDGTLRCTYTLGRFGTAANPYDRVSAQCDIDDDNAFYYYRQYVATLTRNGYVTNVNPSNY